MVGIQARKGSLSERWDMVRWPFGLWIFSAFASITVACADPLDVDIVAVDIVGDVVIRPGQEAVLEVTATNRSSQRVVWGMGSSSCQLGLVVLVDRQTRSIDFRVCTDDLVEQGLDGGERRAEAFRWGGQVVSDGETTMLPPGRYRVFGVAGDRGSSAPLRVTIAEAAGT